MQYAKMVDLDRNQLHRRQKLCSLGFNHYYPMHYSHFNCIRFSGFRHAAQYVIVPCAPACCLTGGVGVNSGEAYHLTTSIVLQILSQSPYLAIVEHGDPTTQDREPVSTWPYLRVLIVTDDESKPPLGWYGASFQFRSTPLISGNM